MSIDNFKPDIWSARLRRHLDGAFIYAQPTVSNRNWEGEIADMGDSVKINKVGDPSIFEYVPNEDMPAPETPDGESVTLLIDQFRGFNVGIDDVDAAQVNVALLDEFAKRSGVAMAKDTDANVAAQMVLGAHADNQLGTDGAPVAVLASGDGDFTPYELAVELARLLADQDAPEDGLWIAIDPTLEAQFRLDENFILADRGRGGDSVVRTGKIGEVAGFDVLRTTRTPKTANATKILAGAGNYATTFANQLTKVKAYEPELRHGDAVKGLEVYGAKVIEPETLALAHVEGGESS